MNRCTSSWKANTSTVNLYNQTPCITLRKNPNSNDIEALMFYTVAGVDKSLLKLSTIRKASLYLGSSGGIVDNNDINGNAGWSTTTSSNFFTNISKCGGVIPKHSLVVNIDMLPEWNQDLQQEQMIHKVDDEDKPLGNVANANTVKSNIYLNKSTGAVLDNLNTSNPTKLMILDNGQRTGSPMLSLGSRSTNLAINTIQASKTIIAGTVCDPSEIGKTSVNGGAPTSSNLNQYLSKNTLVCSLNTALCTNGSNTCYLPSTANKITFRNLNGGIQNNSGTFLCPSTIPYLDAKSVPIPTVTKNLNMYTENSQSGTFNLFSIQGCSVGKACTSIDFKYNSVAPTGFDSEVFSVPVTYKYGYISNYSAIRGFNSVGNNPTINYNNILDKSGQCFGNWSSYGNFTSTYDNVSYHYRICYSRRTFDWWHFHPSQIIVIQDVGNLGVLDVQYATCSNGADYSINN